MNKPMYKVERTTGKGWYEVMLSPFKTPEDTASYISKYKCYYPKEDRKYKITNLLTGVTTFFDAN
jgi:hypothetical protein